MRKYFAIALLCGLMHGWTSVTAQEKTKLPSKYRKIQKYMDKAVESGLVGLSFYIDHPKHGQWTSQSGFTNLETKEQVAEESVFYLGSISKNYTATIILQLKEQGLLSLDDKMSDYLPEKVVQGFQYGDQVTIRQLLNMTTGFPNFEYDEKALGDYFEGKLDLSNTPPPEVLVQYIYGQPGNFKPGERYQYSSTNYILLCMIMEIVTGQPHAVLYSKLFEDYGLNHTYYKGEKAPAELLVEGYADEDDDGHFENTSDQQKAYADWSYGEDGVTSTLSDMVKYFDLLLDGQIISEESLSEMKTWGIPDRPRYGLGLMYDKGFPYKYFIGHSGWGFGTQANLMYFPEQDITIGILCNTAYRFGGEKIEKAHDKFLTKTAKKLFLF